MSAPYKYDSKVQKELRDVTGTSKRSMDTEIFYKQRLMHSAYTLTEAEWEKLSEPAQRWVIEAIDKYNKNQPMPAYPDEDEVKARRSAGASHSAKHRESNMKRAKRGAGDRVKEIMLERGIRTPPLEIYRILQNEGYKYSKHTVPVVRAEFRRALQMLYERGMLTEKPEDLYDEDKKTSER
jgi:hypothetical protein